jgi:3-hydroxy-9,10-secoandrosta-1,3,5(10)-triene-9,17-dione monooxygenase reductase component
VIEPERPGPGAQIHDTDPFATPESRRSPVRRLRGRLPAAVTLWTASDPDSGPAGLTVASTLIADGEPARVLGLLDPESDLLAAAEAAGRFAVVPLGTADRQLADRFAGLLPAPGGLFAGGGWRQTPYGPVPAGAATWAGCRLDATRPLGWGSLVEGTVEHIDIGADGTGGPLVHFRGRYRDLADR